MEVVAEVVPLWSFAVQLEVVDQSPSALVCRSHLHVVSRAVARACDRMLERTAPGGPDILSDRPLGVGLIGCGRKDVEQIVRGDSLATGPRGRIPGHGQGPAPAVTEAMAGAPGAFCTAARSTTSAARTVAHSATAANSLIASSTSAALP